MFVEQNLIAKLAKVAGAIGVAIVLSSCNQGGGNSGNSGGGTVATTPQSCTATSTNNCGFGPNGAYGYPQNCPNPNLFNCGVNGGYTGYVQPTIVSSSYYVCPSGYQLVSSPNLGAACIPGYQFNQFYGNYGAQYSLYYTSSSIAYGFYFGSSNPAATNMPQMTYSQDRSAVISCDVRVQNSCGSTAQCQAVSGGSSLGLCVSSINAATGPNCSYDRWGFYRCFYSNYGYGFNSGFGFDYGNR